ncbi:uncharacterized protein LOC143145334 [Ptiloglossa arizonensis]|uniref:uncharacterized protein LOC143145334 n=1 Tax=Ptiloglossa arizonensis TaxID=3350558 RepID=UPI003FA11733
MNSNDNTRGSDYSGSFSATCFIVSLTSTITSTAWDTEQIAMPDERGERRGRWEKSYASSAVSDRGLFLSWLDPRMQNCCSCVVRLRVKFIVRDCGVQGEGVGRRWIECVSRKANEAACPMPTYSTLTCIRSQALHTRPHITLSVLPPECGHCAPYCLTLGLAIHYTGAAVTYSLLVRE